MYRRYGITCPCRWYPLLALELSIQNGNHRLEIAFIFCSGNKWPVISAVPNVGINVCRPNAYQYIEVTHDEMYKLVDTKITFIK